MAAPNRADKFQKLFKALRRHFQPVPTPPNRTLLENLLYACCLENSKFDAADEAFARLQQDFFDWNEIRV
jgi:endonuclease-3